MDRLSVAELSQPAAFVRPVLVCEPAPKKVSPSQVNGNAFGQMLESVVEVVAEFIVTMTPLDGAELQPSIVATTL